MQTRLDDHRHISTFGIADRRAHDCCVIVVVRSADDPQPLVGEGVWAGEVARAPAGEGGFGYDPLFIPDGFSDTFGLLPAETKNQLSHRARALAAMKETLATLA